MRCASNTADSRCTWARCCKSSTPLTRSASCVLSAASGSRDSGAPALAASRCQARPSAILSLGKASRASALAAHSAPMASWPLARFNSSSFSRRGLAAPLSRTVSSLNTSCMCSLEGLPANHSRMRAARSPEVGAENAPPVKESSGCSAWGLEALAVEVFTAVLTSGWAVAEEWAEKRSMGYLEKNRHADGRTKPRIFAGILVDFG